MPWNLLLLFFRFFLRRYHLEVRPPRSAKWNARPWEDKNCSRDYFAAVKEAEEMAKRSLVFSPDGTWADGSPITEPTHVRVTASSLLLPWSKWAVWGDEQI